MNYQDSPLLFSKKEKRGIITLLIFLLIAYQIPSIYFKYFIAAPSIKIQLLKDSGQTSFNDSCSSLRDHSFNSDTGSMDVDRPPERFYFNPNTINENEWRALGVKAKTIRTINNFLSKGGSFRQPEDLKKIWGMPEHLARELMPFVTLTSNRPVKNKRDHYSVNPPKTIIELNTSDSIQLKSLPGVGVVLSRRIIAYRNLIGGYYEVNQLKEVWGVTDSLVNELSNYLTVNPQKVKKFNLNTVTVTELQRHPYFRNKVARAMIDFRNQHGFLKSLEDIQKIVLISEETFKKIIHYLVVE